MPAKKLTKTAMDPLLAERLARMDGWVNMATALGTSADKRSASTFTTVPRLGQQFLADIYAGCDTVARVVDLLPDEGVREGWEVPSDVDGGLERACDALRMTERLHEAWCWSRLDGGAIILIGAFDGRRMSSPLDEERIQDVTYLTVFDCWEAKVAKRYTDPFKPGYGEPELYELIISDVGVAGEGLSNALTRDLSPQGGTGLGRLVHESRVVRFDGQLAKRADKRAFFSWGPGIIDRTYSVIKDFDTAYASVAGLIHEFGQGVLKIKDLARKMSEQNGEKLVQRRIAMLSYLSSSLRAMPIDAEYEDFVRIGTPVSGLADLLDRTATRLSSATGYPVTLFFGQSPAGLNSTGDGEAANFYNVVKSGQKAHLTQPLTKLLRVIAKGKKLEKVLDAYGEVPFTYRQLWQPSDKEVSEARLNDAKADDLRIANGSLTPQEVADSRYGSGRYSAEIKLDPAVKAREIPVPPAAPVAPGAAKKPTK